MAAFKFIQSGYLSEDAISALASNIRDSWSNNNYWPSAHEVKLAALLAARGTDLVSVEHMSLVDIDITSIKDDNITSLASVVSEQVDLNNVTGNVDLVISNIECSMLFISNMRLEQWTTQILARCVQTSVECLFVGMNGTVKLHIRTLLQYDGQGRCRHMELFGETGNTYGDLLRTWATRVQWTVREERSSIVVTREENTIVAQESEDLQENTVPTIQQNIAGHHNTLAGGNLVH